MKKIFVVVILVTIYTLTFASVIDSLNSILIKPDADEGAIYIRLSLEYLNISPDKSIEYAILALEYVKTNKEQVDYLNQLGIAYEYSGQYHEAIHEYNRALKIAETIHYTIGKGISLLNTAIAKVQLADYDNALDLALKAIKIFDFEDDIKHLTSTINTIGNIYLQIGDHEQALAYYEVALNKKQEMEDEPGIALILHNIALVYMGQENWVQGQDYLERSLESMQKVDNKYGMAFCYNNLSSIYSSKEKEDYQQAIEYNFKALSYFEEIENPEGIAYTCNLLGSHFLSLKSYVQAFDQFRRSLNLSKEMGLSELISENYNSFSDYYEALGDYKQAYEYLVLHKAKNDSIFSQKKSEKISKLQSKYEIESEEEKITKLQERKRYQRKIYIILLIVFIFGSMIVAFLYIIYREKLAENSIRKDTENKLIESQNKFQKLTENIALAVFTFSIEGIFTYVNPSTANITGFSEEELLAKKFFDIIHPDYKERVMAGGFNRIKGENDVQKFECKIITKQHDIRWVEIFNSRTTIGGLVVVLGTATDITDRKEADQRIRESEGRYKHLVESIEEGMIIADELESITFANKAARTIFGYSAKELENMNLRKLVSSADFKRLQLETDKRIKGHSSKYEMEIIRKDGERRLILITASPLVHNEDYSGAIGIFVDITEIRKAEDKIKSQLHEKEVMLQEIYHRVKNNLQIISSMLKLQAFYVDDEYASHLFSNCQHRVKSMSLVHEKLYRSDNLSKISFKDYAESLIKNLFSSLNISDNRIKYELDINDVNLNISTAIPCGLIINELITNALKYGFPGKKEGIIKISMVKLENDKLKLTVWNNGVDLPEDFDMENLSTFGMRLVDILAHQIEAQLTINRTKRVAFSLIFTLKE